MPLPLLAVPLITGAISLFSSLFGAKQQSNAAKDIAKQQLDAQSRSDAAAAKAAADALSFQREESALARQSAEVSRRGNYEWDASRERRIGSIGEMVGLGKREIPSYVPLNGADGAAGVDLGGAQQAFYSLFPEDTLTPQMLTERKADLEAAGFTLRPNAKGVVGKVQYQGGPIIDVIRGADAGVNKRQWLVGGPTPQIRSQVQPNPMLMTPNVAAFARRGGVRTAPLTVPGGY